MKKLALLALAAGALSSSAAAAGGNDFGLHTQQLLKALAFKEFGILKPLEAGAIEGVDVARAPGQGGQDLVTLAKGLKARILTRQAGGVADMFAFWPDGANRDLETDGCVAVLGVKDPTAEPTGFEFTADGKTAVVSIQHSGDAACNAVPGSDCADVDDYPTDDILVLTGFKILPGMLK